MVLRFKLTKTEGIEIEEFEFATLEELQAKVAELLPTATEEAPVESPEVPAMEEPVV